MITVAEIKERLQIIAGYSEKKKNRQSLGFCWREGEAGLVPRRATSMMNVSPAEAFPQTGTRLLQDDTGSMVNLYSTRVDLAPNDLPVGCAVGKA